MSTARTDAEFTEFVHARLPYFRRVTVAICRDPHRAEDVLQTALTKLYVAWPRVRRDGAEEAYLRRIIVRADIDDRRRPWRRERDVPPGLDPAAREGLGVAHRLSMYAALQELPDAQRRVVVLRHWMGLSVAETAADLGLAEGTVKAYTSRALETLRTRLEDPPDLPDGVLDAPADAVATAPAAHT